MKVVLDTAYDDFDLYHITLGQSLPSVFIESFGLVLAMEMYMPKRAMSADGVSILEVLAGANSTHSLYIKTIMQQYGFKCSEFISLDKAAKSGNGVEQIDVRNFSLETKFDVIAGFYYALGAIIPSGREHTLSALRCIYNNLNKGGMFFTTILPDSYHTILSDEESSSFSTDSEITWDVPPYCTSWRKRLGIPFNKDPLELVGRITETYDRRTATVYYTYSNFRLRSKYDDTVFIKFKIKRPIPIRYWSESEVADLAAEAGFDRNNLYFLDLDENGMVEVDHVVYSHDDADASTNVNAVVMVR